MCYNRPIRSDTEGTGTVEQQSTKPDFPWAKGWPEITDQRVRHAFSRVPRAQFVPAQVQRWSDEDAPLPIGEGQTISQPFVVALMTQALALQPGDKTLEIGTGSGYQTAILCELTTGPQEPAGIHVYSVERFRSLAQNAAATLDRLGCHPQIAIGDGAAGWPAMAPFAAIIVTAAPSYLPRPLWDQLAEGGRMVIPIGAQPEEQVLWLIRKTAGKLDAQGLGAVRFVPLISPLLDDPRMRINIRTA